MAKFCTQCGRRLEEGEVCNCTQEAQSAEQKQSTTYKQSTAAPGAAGWQQSGDQHQSGDQYQSSAYTNYQGGQQSQSAGPRQQSQGTNYQQYGQPQYNQGVGGNQQYNQGMNSGQQYRQGMNNGQQYRQGMNNGQQSQWAGMNSQQMKQMGAQAMAGAQNMFREVLPILKRPVTETRRIAAGNSPLVGLELIGLKALVILIIVLIAASRISGAANGLIQMPYFKLVILVLLLTLGVDALEAVLLNVFAGMFKGSANINAMFCVVGSRALYDGIIAIVAGILAPFFLTGSVFVLVFGSLILPYVQYGAYRAVAQGDDDRRVYAFFLVKVISSLVLYIILYMMAADMLTSMLGSAMSGFGSGLGSGFGSYY